MKERHTAILTNPKNFHDGHSLILFQDPQAGYGYFYSGIFESYEPAVIPTTKGESDGYYKSFYRIITYEIPQQIDYEDYNSNCLLTCRHIPARCG